MKDKQEDHLQAVILLDHSESPDIFEPYNLFKPTHDTPSHSCLLPLCNLPMIEYTMEWLHTCKPLSDIYIIGNSRSVPIVKRYLLEQSPWSDHVIVNMNPDESHSRHTHSSGSTKRLNSAMNNLNIAIPMISIHCLILPPRCETTGDKLRELDSLGLIVGDFLLLDGGAAIFSNTNISKLWEVHRQKRTVDKNVILTNFLRVLPPDHPRRNKREKERIYILQEKTNKILAIQDIPLADGLSKIHHQEQINPKDLQVRVPISCKAQNISIRSDLVDTNVYLCSQEILALFTENFDYQYLMTDFYQGIMTSDLLSYEIHGGILSEIDWNNSYLQVVRDPFTYDSVSKDLLRRWIFPLVPGTNNSHYSNSTCSYSVRQQGQLYLANPSIGHLREILMDTKVSPSDAPVIAPSATLTGYNLLSLNVIIGEHCTLTNCVLGPNVHVQNNCQLENVYLFGNAIIEKNCKLTNGMVGNAVHIYADSNLCGMNGGWMLCDYVIIEPRANLSSKDDFRFYVATNTTASLNLTQFSISLEAENVFLRSPISRLDDSCELEFNLSDDEENNGLVRPGAEAILLESKSSMTSSTSPLGSLSNAILCTASFLKSFKRKTGKVKKQESDSDSDDTADSEGDVVDISNLLYKTFPSSKNTGFVDFLQIELLQEMKTYLKEKLVPSYTHLLAGSSKHGSYKDSVLRHSYGQGWLSSPPNQDNKSITSHSISTSEQAYSQQKSLDSSDSKSISSNPAFARDVKDTLQPLLLAGNAVVLSELIDTCALECQALKFSYNCSLQELSLSIHDVLLDGLLANHPVHPLYHHYLPSHPPQIPPHLKDPTSYRIQKFIQSIWAPFYEKLHISLNESSQVTLLQLLESKLSVLSLLQQKQQQQSSHPAYFGSLNSFIAWIISAWYQEDILSERGMEIFLSKSDPDGKLRVPLSSMLTYLENQLDDDDDDEEDDEDEDEEEEEDMEEDSNVSDNDTSSSDTN